MESIFFILAVLEMLCMNMYTFHICSEKRYPTFVIILVIGLFTGIFLWASKLLFGDMNFLGKGILLVSGMVYLLPLKFLYRQSVRYSVTIMCSCWIYTALVYALSVQLASLFLWWEYMAALLAMQTVLYTLTILPFFRFFTRKFLYIIKKADLETQKLLFWLGICWCLFFFLLNCLQVDDVLSFSAKLTKIFILCTSAINVVITYQIFYFSRCENQNALAFKRELKLDGLTGMKNRMAFFEEAQTMIDNHTPFTIFFIDLNNFKSVNDNYGHVKGDQYLQQFSDIFSTYLSSLGTVYRISGDEFIFLCNVNHDHLACKKIGHFNMKDCAGIPFNGFSMGSASYPEDAKTLNLLITVADKRMYDGKKVK